MDQITNIGVFFCQLPLTEKVLEMSFVTQDSIEIVR